MNRLLALSLVLATPAAAQSQAETEVLGVVKAMLDVIRTKDVASVRQYVDSTTRFTLTRPTPDGGTRVVVLTGDQFLQNVGNPGGQPAVELIRNPEVRIDGDLAQVWLEYQFHVNGQMSHCGFDAFHLVKTGGGWKVVNISDSFRRECGAMWKP